MADNKEYMHREGNLHISEDVVTAIVIGAAKEIEGVFAVTPLANVSSYMKKNGKAANRGVKITADEEGLLSIDLSLTVNYGGVIPELAEKVQQAVASSVEAMTGYRVAAVNVNVIGVHLD